MKIFEKLYENCTPLYPMEGFCEPGKALYLDIETTGLKKETTSLYMIGCGYYTAEGFNTRLVFAESPNDEPEVLDDLSSFLNDFSHIFTFNGTGFDIPYLKYKAEMHGITGLFDGISHIDIYKLCKPLRYLLFTDSMRQKAIESFLQIGRDDRFDGGQLIEVYKHYVSHPNEEDLTALITHNREDVLGMHLIMPILYYLDFRDAPLEFSGYRMNKYSDFNGEECEEVIFSYTTSLSFPKSFSAKTETMYLKASADDGTILIRLPVYSGEMKIFFENYKDYCYIPDEDEAILKSLAYLLPKSRYQKAVKENCYRRISGKFIKQPSSVFTPVVKTSYKDKKKYFRFPDCFNKEAADEFGRELINVFFTMKKR